MGDHDDKTSHPDAAPGGSIATFERLLDGVGRIEAAGEWGGDLDRLTELAPDELVRLLRGVASAKRALDAIEARSLDLVEKRGVTVARRGHRTRRWWANELGTSHASSSHRVRVATRLHEHYPLVAAALEAGQCSFEQAAALIRRETERTRPGFQELQPHLVVLAQSEPFERFEQAIDAIAQRLDPDGPRPDDPRINRLRITNEFGNTRITALFDPANAEIVLNAIKRAVDAETSCTEALKLATEPTGTALAADRDASADAAEKGGCAGPGGSCERGGAESGGISQAPASAAPGLGNEHSRTAENIERTDVPEPAGCSERSERSERSAGKPGAAVGPPAKAPPGRMAAEGGALVNEDAGQDLRRLGELPEAPGDSIARIQAQAFLRICETAIAACDRPGRPPTAHIDLIVRENDEGFAATKTTNGLVHGNRLDETLCNAVFRVVKTSRDGTPLNVGRATRLATADQRRAVLARDGGCVFPGCAAPASATDLHHVHQWRDGGPTDLENLACLCRFHHSVTHRADWKMLVHTPTVDCPHRFEWVTPSGDILRSQAHDRAPGAVAG